MSVEIWKGVCNAGFFSVDPQNTTVLAYRERGKVTIFQVAEFEEDEAMVVMDESEAIDIALCILAELAPGMFYNLKKED